MFYISWYPCNHSERGTVKYVDETKLFQKCIKYSM